MKVIGRIYVVKCFKERLLQGLLTILLVASVILVIGSLLIDEKIQFSLFVPFLYLLFLRAKMGDKYYVKDTEIILSRSDDFVIFELSNYLFTNNQFYSVRYKIPLNQQIDIFYEPNKNKFQMKCMSKKILLNEENLIEENTKLNSIEFYIDIQSASDLMKYLNLDNMNS